MNKLFDMLTPFSLTLCGRGVEVGDGAGIYRPYKNKTKFLHLDIDLEYYKCLLKQNF